MSRCEERHPSTKKRCVLEAGHDEEHDPEPHTREERAEISDAMSDDGMKLIELWCRRSYPPVAIAGAFLALYRTVADLREVEPGDQVREMMCALGGRNLSDSELFVFVAERLGVSCDVLRVGNQKTAS